MNVRSRRVRSKVLSAQLEALESRTLLSGIPWQELPPRVAAGLRVPNASHPILAAKRPQPHSASYPGSAVTPEQMRHAYGIDLVNFGGVAADGYGQTIAIIDAYHYLSAYSDLVAFDNTFGLPHLAQYDPLSPPAAGVPYFRQVSQNGDTVFPPTDPAGPGDSWAIESALDIQWAHAIAPRANIILVEATSTSFTDLVTKAADWARNAPGVSVISMSFGATEFSVETSYDSYFSTPAGHQGVTFFSSTGDDGKPGGYPAYSPNVVAVGGTTLTLTNGNYTSESGWSGSGGGTSNFESQPSWQNGIVTQSSTRRATPDVSMDADPNTGVGVYDTWDFGAASPWEQFGGTSLSSPMWAGIMAIINQGRALAGFSSLDGGTQTLPKLYALPASDFHDITTGSNGFSAGAGYDLVTGRGTPIANLLIPHMVGASFITGSSFIDANANGTRDGGESGISGVAAFLDTNGNGVRDLGATSTFVSSDVSKSIPDNNATGVTSTLTISGTSGFITDLNLNFSITHSSDEDLTAYLIAPDGTQVKLFSGVGGTSNNFGNTTLDDQAGTFITSGSAPFTGSFKPSAVLAAFNGFSANGQWKFKVVDSARRDSGSITAWSLTITRSAEPLANSDGNGGYSFAGPVGNYTVYETAPATYIATNGTTGAVIGTAGNTAGANFGNFPTIFNTPSATASYYLSLDNTGTFLQIFSGTSAGGTPAYQINRTLVPTLTFNLTGASSVLTVNYANGSQLVNGNLTVNGVYDTNQELRVYGQSPAYALTMSDSQIGPTNGGTMIVFNTMPTLTLYSGTVVYSGTLSTLQNLNINSGTTFYWT